jgi:hypothetical protein
VAGSLVGMETNWWVRVCLCLSLVGCTSTESRCETLCKWADQCTELSANCSDADIDDCVEDIEDQDSGCQDGFDDFVDCLDDQDLVCSDIEEHCVGEFSEYVEQCT